MNFAEIKEMINSYFFDEQIEGIESEIVEDSKLMWRWGISPGIYVKLLLYPVENEIYIWIEADICVALTSYEFLLFISNMQYHYPYPMRICESESTVSCQYRCRVDLNNKEHLYYIISNFMDHSVAAYILIKEKFSIKAYINSK